MEQRYKEAAAGTTALQLNETLSEKCKRMKVSIEAGRMTLNKSRQQFGLSPINDSAADTYLKKV